MPTFLSSIPGISSLPNPLNIFNQDNSNQSNATHQHQQQGQGPSTPTRSSSMASSLQVAGPNSHPTENMGPVARLSSILSKGFDALSPPTTPSHASTTDPDATPRSMLRNGAPADSSTPMRKNGSNVVIAGEAADDSPRSQHAYTNGRSRGMSSATATTTNSGEQRKSKRRVETFVLVKPPPTSAKNPLNLQVQLVVPARTGRPRRGSDPTRISADNAVPLTPAKSASTDTTDSKTTTTSSASSSSNNSSPEPKGTALPTVSEEADKATKLVRRSSTGSNRSLESYGAASTASSSSGKQRIIPLYNLAVHNVVQPTTVTDAGTDSKVAKFLKRSLDISGVGILEPMEVWLPLQNGNSEASPRTSVDATSTTSRRPVSTISTMSLLSPAPSRIEEKRASLDSRTGLAPRGENEDGPKKFFGKIFRKRNSADPLVERRTLGRITSSKSSHFLAAEAGPSTGHQHLQVPAPVSAPGSPVVQFTGSEKELIGYPTFGLSPAVLKRRASDAQLNPNGAIVGLTSDVPTTADEEEVSLARSARPIGYTWTVRKWAKKNTEGWASHIVAAAAAGLDLVAGSLPGDGADEVVFEWVKMRVTPRKESGVAALRRHPASDGMDSAAKARLSRPVKPKKKGTPVPSRDSSPQGSRTSLPLRAKNRANRAASLAVDPGATLAAETDVTMLRSKSSSPRPPPPQRRTSEAASSRSDAASVDSRQTDEDDRRTTASADDKLCAAIEAGYDSDPEDSETPWSCSVWVKRTGQRQLLATLTPAPHHPKVVGVLKIPSGIKSLTLADIGSAAGKPDLAARVKEEVCLTEENIKDVVNVTAMWLVAREEFSGFGRKRKHHH